MKFLRILIVMLCTSAIVLFEVSTSLRGYATTNAAICLPIDGFLVGFLMRESLGNLKIKSSE